MSEERREMVTRKKKHKKMNIDVKLKICAVLGLFR